MMCRCSCSKLAIINIWKLLQILQLFWGKNCSLAVTIRNQLDTECILLFIILIIIIIISKLTYDIYCEATTGTHIPEFDFKKLKN